MSVSVRAYTEDDLKDMTDIWNEVVNAGQAFPQEETLSVEEARVFFAGQDHTGVAEEGGKVLGLYILHPNNVGRCGHISNTSYAVKEGNKGKGIGEKLVRDSLKTAASIGYKLMQFNAVVANNVGAIHLYKKLGFQQLGVIPKGFRLKDGTYEDILPFYITL